MAPGKDVQVKTGDTHDGVVRVGLVRNSDFGEFVPDVGKVVVG